MEPREGERHGVGETHFFEFEVRTVFDPTIGETFVVHPAIRFGRHRARHIGLLAFILPTIHDCGGLVGDAVGTFELHALVVVDVVAERILEIQIERQALPGQ